MKLTRIEKDMLRGSQGQAVRKSMEILTALGEIFGARRLIPVSSVQIAGVSYHNLGDAGLEFLAEMAVDGKTRVHTTLNPAGMDLENWQELGISADFAEKQNRVIDAFARMGVITTCTCTPYLVGNNPRPGDHISWSESSAVCYANSVLGARTNREGGPSALASALTGRTAEFGLHLDEKRQAQIIVQVQAEVKTVSDFGALGCAIGRRIGNRIPLIRGIASTTTTTELLKSFSASIATYGGTAMFHMEGVTPNATTLPQETVTISAADLAAARSELNDETEIDFVALGCPHCTIEEVEQIAGLLDGKNVQKEFWICLARPVKELAEQRGLAQIITRAGAKFACDTCLAVAPLKGRFKGIATNSAKGVYYGRGKNEFKTIFCDMEECVRIAMGGQ